MFPIPSHSSSRSESWKKLTIVVSCSLLPKFYSERCKGEGSACHKDNDLQLGGGRVHLGQMSSSCLKSRPTPLSMQKLVTEERRFQRRAMCTKPLPPNVTTLVSHSPISYSLLSILQTWQSCPTLRPLICLILGMLSPPPHRYTPSLLMINYLQ